MCGAAWSCRVKYARCCRPVVNITPLTWARPPCPVRATSWLTFASRDHPAGHHGATPWRAGHHRAGDRHLLAMGKILFTMGRCGHPNPCPSSTPGDIHVISRLGADYHGRAATRVRRAENPADRQEPLSLGQTTLAADSRQAGITAAETLGEYPVLVEAEGDERERERWQ